MAWERKRKLSFEVDEDYHRPQRDTRLVVVEGECSVFCSIGKDVGDQLDSHSLFDKDLDIKYDLSLSSSDRFGSPNDDLQDSFDDEPHSRDRPRSRGRFKGKKKRPRTLVEVPVEQYLDPSCENDDYENFNEQNKVIVKQIPSYYNNVKTLCEHFEKFGDIRAISCFHGSETAHIVFHNAAHATAASMYPMVLMDRSNRNAWGHSQMPSSNNSSARKPRQKAPSFKTRGFKPRKKWSKLVKHGIMSRRVRENALNVLERKTRFMGMCEKLKNNLQTLRDKEPNQSIRDFFQESIAKCERYLFYFKTYLNNDNQKLAIRILLVEQQKKRLIRDLMDLEMEMYMTKTLDMNLIHRIDQLTHELLHPRV